MNIELHSKMLMFVFAGVTLVAMELTSTAHTVEIVSLLLLTEKRENLGAISHVATQLFKIVSALHQL